MSDVTRILLALEPGAGAAAAELLPLVYAELRRVAARHLVQEKPGQTLDATALVHEAYLRLVAGDNPQRWDNRRHFFAAAAEAMRRILMNRARDKGRQKRGGSARRIPLDRLDLVLDSSPDDLLDLDEALEKLAGEDAASAALVQLRLFAGLSHQEAARTLGIPRRSADRLWAFARAWLFAALGDEKKDDSVGAPVPETGHGR